MLGSEVITRLLAIAFQGAKRRNHVLEIQRQ